MRAHGVYTCVFACACAREQPVIGIGLLGSAFSWAMIAANPCVGTIVVGTIVLGTTVSVVTTSFAAITDVTARILRQRRAARKSLERYLRRNNGHQGSGSGGGRRLFTGAENLATNLPRVPRPAKVVAPLHPKAAQENVQDESKDKKASSKSTTRPSDAPPVNVLDDFGTVGYSRPETPKVGSTAGASPRKVPASTSQLAPPLSTYRSASSSTTATAAVAGVNAEKPPSVAAPSSTTKKAAAPNPTVGSSSLVRDEVTAVSAPDFRSMTSPVMAPVQTHASAADERLPTSHAKAKDKSKEKKEKKSRRDKREKLHNASFDPSVDSLPGSAAVASEAAGSSDAPSSSTGARVGDRVLVRDLPSEPWAAGTVVALTAVTGGEFPLGHPIVRRDGWDLPFAFQDWAFLKEPNAGGGGGGATAAAAGDCTRNSAQLETGVPPPPPSLSTTPKIPPPAMSPASKAAAPASAPASKLAAPVPTPLPTPALAAVQAVHDDDDEDGPDWLSACVVGDRLEVRDDDGGDEGVWFAGVVTEAASGSGGLPCVMRDGR